MAPVVVAIVVAVVAAVTVVLVIVLVVVPIRCGRSLHASRFAYGPLLLLILCFVDVLYVRFPTYLIHWFLGKDVNKVWVGMQHRAPLADTSCTYE